MLFITEPMTMAQELYSVLELATAFAKAKAAGNGPRRSIVFMTVSG